MQKETTLRGNSANATVGCCLSFELEKNKLILEFLDYEFLNDDEEEYPFGLYVNKRETWEKREVPATHSQFHYSWDYLMPVIEKINKISEQSNDREYYYHLMTIVNAIRKFDGIKAVWAAAIIFIEFHNRRMSVG